VAADRLVTASASRGLVTANLRMVNASPGLAMLNPVIVQHALLVIVSENRGLAMLNLATARHVPLVMVSASRGPVMENLVIALRVPAATVLSVMANESRGLVTEGLPMVSASPGPRTAAGQVLRETRVRGAQEATDPSAITTRIRSRRGSSSAAKSARSNRNLNPNSREQTLIVRLSAISPR
jgi:hypothetical protein